MAKIFIGQYYGKSFFSKLIKWRTWSEISHTAAFLPALVDDIYVCSDIAIEAWGKGITKGYYKDTHTPGTKIDIYSIYTTTVGSEKFYSWLYSKIGGKYDWKAIIGFVTRSHLESSSRWFCSELIYQAMVEAKIYPLQNIEPHQVAPGILNISPILNYEKTITT